MISLAWRLFRREIRSGELRLLFAALAIAVAAVTTVGFFTERIGLALTREAQQLIGGDLVLVSDHALPAAYTAEAARRGLQLAETFVFPSMVLAGGRPQLVDVKAVSSAYPLRGQLGISSKIGMPTTGVSHGPARGEVWVDERMAGALQNSETLQLGGQTFAVTATLTQEPDRGINFFSLAPRLMMDADDLAATGLLQFGSRVSYRLLLAGGAADIAAFRDWLTPRLARGERLEDARNARPEIRNALDRAERFLGLAALLSVVLAAVAVAMASRRYLQRHLDACALMRCVGLSQRRLLALHALQFGWLALFAALVGALVGFAAHHVLIGALGRLLAVALPPTQGLPVMHGVAVAFVLLFGFALPPLLQLARVPTLRVLRRDLGTASGSQRLAFILGFGLLAALIVVVAGDTRLGLIAAGGFFVALLVFWGLARGVIALLGAVRGGAGAGWRQGLASLRRHGAANALQVAALAVGLMAMLLLTVIRGELLGAWQQALPADAPNRFIINIQPEQRAGVGELLTAAGIDAELLPMIRARLTRIGDRTVSAADYPDDERAQRLVEREFNLSWHADLPVGNVIAAGRWFQPDEAGQGLASVEAGLAVTLGIGLGDTLTFNVAGIEKQLRVSNLRRLSWDSMRVNFFVMTPPGVIEDAPASYITSFYLPPAAAGLPEQLLTRYPNLTLIDLAGILAQFQNVLTQVAAAVQFVFVFTLLAGGVVLYAALLSAFDARRHELAVMRALGASRRQLQSALLLELGLVGALAGLIASLGADALGEIIARQAFQMSLQHSPITILLAVGGGATLTMLVGGFAVRRLLGSSPLLALRAAS